MKRTLYLILTLTLVVAMLCACSPSGSFPSVDEGILVVPDSDGNFQYEEIVENGFISTTDQTTSYFSLDRNTASYSLMRRQINSGLTIAPGSVRLEEYVNYFNYDYIRPENDALALSGSVFNCPWNSQNKLFTIGVAAEEISFENAVQNNIVFLIDTSGSMYGSDRLGLIQQSFTMLLEYLGDDDYISIVTY